jgi:hypothetical protein
VEAQIQRRRDTQHPEASPLPSQPWLKWMEWDKMLASPGDPGLICDNKSSRLTHVMRRRNRPGTLRRRLWGSAPSIARAVFVSR